MSKIKSQEEIIEIAENLKKTGKKVVVYNGSFDLLHLGHINSLKEAKKQGDVLILLLNSDKSVKLYKGPNRPIIPQEERAQTLAALEAVDYITLFDEINPKEILGKIKPDIYCSGPDWGKNCIERKVVEENGGEIYVLKATKGLSTTELIKKILDVYSKPEVKAVFLDRDGTININNPEYVHRIEDFKFVEGSVEALQKLSQTDYKIFVITNQSGIARGYYTEEDFEKLNNWFLEFCQKNNIRIDKVYHCSHHPKITSECDCRKPKPGMLLQAVKDYSVNLAKSWVIGDGDIDIMAGREVNAKTIKIGDKMPPELKLEPNYYAQNLLEAFQIIH
ncbi:MAG: D-glycero-beta-D-manno-heptose 1,7-bisphosphate 7-phosphatase [Candidatus Pacebacteria bacterium]|nr:D-glycero-beta-D-manno-heptose 1,7-bisphosphate 7-phosphatase [Candidatus Paceibacterota bacterium]